MPEGCVISWETTAQILVVIRGRGEQAFPMLYLKHSRLHTTHLAGIVFSINLTTKPYGYIQVLR